MVVKIEEIREGGLELTDPMGLKLLERALTQDGPDTGFRPVAPAPGKVKLTRVGTDVVVKGDYAVTVKAPCKRCLTDVEVAVPVSFTLDLVPEAKKKPEDDEGGATGEAADDGGDHGGSFDLTSADQETYDGRQIDLDPILREQVLLALPMHAVCREDCRGLCSQCGQNLNEQQCACDQKVIDPRLAALKNIKLKSN